MGQLTRAPPCQTDIGESFSIVGNLPELGEWSTEGALPLEWAEGHVWCGTLSLPVGTVAEFKVRIAALLTDPLPTHPCFTCFHPSSLLIPSTSYML